MSDIRPKVEGKIFMKLLYESLLSMHDVYHIQVSYPCNEYKVYCFGMNLALLEYEFCIAWVWIWLTVIYWNLIQYQHR